jgi:ABC-type polysaccharide/polyol phosphate transport system ATPase subunit
LPHPTIDAQQVSKRFVLRHNPDPSLKSRFLGLVQKRQREVHEEFWALRDISLAIARGESVGIVGRNGSGKSTFLKLVAGIHRPTTGRLLMPASARVGSMIELGVGFHPDLNGTENVFLNAAINGLSRAQIHDIYRAIVDYSGLEHFMDVPLKNYSSGMHMRLGFAIAANLDPDILLLDEIFAVGDEDFQKQCMKTIERFAAEGRTLLFVSHASASVRAICRRVCLLDHGRLLFDGGVDEGLEEYQRLIASTTTKFAAAPAIAPQTAEAAAAVKDWDDRSGEWVLRLLQREGLQPKHRALEITCGAAGGSASLAQFVGPTRYQHWEISFAMSHPLLPFDYAIAAPLLSRISLNAAVRVIANVLRVMPANGRIYMAWSDDAEPIEVADAPPFAYPFPLIANVAEALGLRASRLSDAAHPAGESVLVLERA